MLAPVRIKNKNWNTSQIADGITEFLPEGKTMDKAKFHGNMYEISKAGDLSKIEVDYMHAFG